jgi:outer membrane protein insertion porin family
VRLTLQARAADGFLGSTPLAVARSQVVGLLPMGPLGLLLGLQAGAGTALADTTTLPLDERFHVGGAGSIRGFEQDSVGPANRLVAYDPGYPAEIEPLIRYAQRSDPYRWVATGGDAMLVATGELKVPLPVLGLHAFEAAALVGFVDVGNAFLLRSQARTSSSASADEPFVRVGTGVGLRYATPIGPLQLDLGVNPAPIADRDEAPVRIHLSLGAF